MLCIVTESFSIDGKLTSLTLARLVIGGTLGIAGLITRSPDDFDKKCGQTTRVQVEVVVIEPANW